VTRKSSQLHGFLKNLGGLSSSTLPPFYQGYIGLPSFESLTITGMKAEQASLRSLLALFVSAGKTQLIPRFSGLNRSFNGPASAYT